MRIVTINKDNLNDKINSMKTLSTDDEVLIICECETVLERAHSKASSVSTNENVIDAQYINSWLGASIWRAHESKKHIYSTFKKHLNDSIVKEGIII